MNNLVSLFTSFDVTLLIKIPYLILIVLYILFALVLLNKVRSLGKMVFISDLNVTLLIDTIAFVHLIVAVSLFFITLVIL